jgi:hypothetical protein
MMQLTLSLRQEAEITGGLTESMFPMVDNLLKQTEYQKALKYAARQKNMDRYRSMVDFLFCEVFTEYQKPCFGFYNNRGRSLKDYEDISKLQRMEPMLVQVLVTAYQMLQDKRKESWGGMVARTLKTAV